MSDVMIPSTAPGLSWSLLVSKYSGNRVVASATEVTYKPAGPGEYFNTTSFDMFGARRETVTLHGIARMTKKVEAEAMALLKAKLLENGLTPA